MKHTRPAPVTDPSGSPVLRAAGLLVPVALVLAHTGCFRATGVSRPAVVVEEIPASGGDRVAGLKATAGPGDFYLGNDSIHMAVDGAAFGDRGGQFGAASGGAILDLGFISLDQSYHRVSMPGDLVERLGPVANQDPDLPLVFDRYLPSGNANTVTLDMEGYLLDAKGKLGVARDAQGRVAGVAVSHRIRLNKGEVFYTLETTLTNSSGAALPLRNLGDHLSQRGGGFRFVVPALTTFSGTPLSTWGVEIPGTDFSAPLTGSVVAPMVGLMGAESAGSTFDAHTSLGIMPLDGDSLLVASDAQHALTESRPLFPARLVVGGTAVASLPTGSSLTYRRRLYVIGGAGYSSALPSQTTSIFNLMAQDRAGLKGEDLGFLAYNTFGTATGGGPFQTELRFERYTYTGSLPFDPSDSASPASQAANWRLERVEWREPLVTGLSSATVGLLVPAIPNAATGLTQRYRLSARNAQQTMAPLYLGTNVLDSNRPFLATAITPNKDQKWQVGEALAPERAEVLDSAGNAVRFKQTIHTFSARQSGTLEFSGLNPLRLTFQGVGVADPQIQRSRRLSSVYSEVYKSKAPSSTNYGAYQYAAGAQIFGTAFTTTDSLASMFFPEGSYLALATRGPLSHLDTLPVVAYAGQTDTNHAFVVTPPVLPSGWNTFDVPGPTQATTGGYNPGEMMASALAEGVELVARTEVDLQTDATSLQNEFRAEIDIPLLSDAQRAPLGVYPLVVGARTSVLADGTVTALFTPTPTEARNGGARPSAGWNLADFITQAEGAYTIVHRPRGPQGLFTLKGFSRTTALGSGANAWWTQTGPSSLGKKLGDFDALELIRAEGLDGNSPDAWYAEFQSVRDDWYALLNQQRPTAFTKGLGLSAAHFSLDTPVGLARTYLKTGTTLTQSTLDPVLAALRAGAAVASTGPLLNVAVGSTGPGGLVAGPVASVTLTIALHAAEWVPVDEVRVVVNGGTPIPVSLASFTPSTTDFTLRTATVTVPMPSGRDAWLVVEAGVSRSQSGVYRSGTPWNRIMKGIYPIAVTNPIFVDVTGSGYTPPGL